MGLMEQVLIPDCEVKDWEYTNNMTNMDPSLACKENIVKLSG